MFNLNNNYICPEGTCNAHLHIIDPIFPNDGKATKQCGTIKEYKKIAVHLNLDRAVFVQAKTFGKDNTCLINAIQQFGKDKSTGIAVVDNQITEQELLKLDAAGVRGVRFSVWNPNNAVVSFNDCIPLSKKIESLGWNIQLHMSSAQLVAYKKIIREIPCLIVIDHMGRLNPEQGVDDPAFRCLCELLDTGNVWVKLSGPYLNTRTKYPWPDATKIARALVNYAPERLVWGSDFPHVTEKIKPTEMELVNQIPQWIDSEEKQKKILVENPIELYNFKK